MKRKTKERKLTWVTVEVGVEFSLSDSDYVCRNVPMRWAIWIDGPKNVYGKRGWFQSAGKKEGISREHKPKLMLFDDV